MSMDFYEILAVMQARRRTQSPLIRMMIEVKRRYNAEWILPMPNSDDEPDFQNYGPSLIADAVEHLSLKAASVRPSIAVPALRPDKLEGGAGSLEWASIRRKAYAATWFAEKMPLHIRQMFKHFTGYATFSAIWMPDFTKERPVLRVRDPLTSFPEPKHPTDLTPPANVGFIAVQSADYLMDRYPESARLVKPSRAGDANMWDVVEWIDDDDVVIGILGPHLEQSLRQDMTTGGWGQNTTGWAQGNAMELRRYPNRAGMVPGVMPMQVTMDRVASAIAKNVGQSDLMAKLMALDILATEKAIFPDRYVIGKTGQTPSIVGGRWKDGREGETNIILDAEKIGLLHNSPDPSNKQAIDRAERNYRVSTGLIPQFGGETYGALRTGRGMDSLEAAATDPRIHEMHEVMEFALTELNRGMCAMYKGNWPDRKYTMFSGWPGDVGHVNFVPSKHFENDENVVTYPILGTDAQTLTIRLAQLLGSKAISLRSFRKKHPDIDDDEMEERQVMLEALEDAALTTLIQQASQGIIPPEDMAAIGQALQQDNDIFAAIKVASDLAQQRQAEQAQPPDQGATGPGGGQLVAPPGMQPGLGAPGAGMENQPPPAPPIGPPAPSLDNFHRLVRDLKVSA